MKKLYLHKETLRALDDAVMDLVVGGGKTNHCLITSTVTVFTCGLSCEYCEDPNI